MISIPLKQYNVVELDFFLVLGSEKYQSKKKVRFADDVEEPSSNNEEYRKRHLLKVKQVLAMKNVTYLGNDHKLERTMPANRQALYKGIIENRTRRE